MATKKTTTKTMVVAENNSLSTELLNGTGITASLTQNDVIEVVATQKYQEIVDKIESLKNRREEIQKLFEAVVDTERSKFKKELIALIPSLVNQDFKVCFDSNKSTSDTHYCYHPSIYTTAKTEKVTSQNTYLYSYSKACFSYTVTEEIKNEKTGITTSTSTVYKKTFNIPKSKYKTILDGMKAHNEEVHDFTKSYDNINISLDANIRSTKVLFNKTLIRSKATEVVGLIEQVFNVKL